MCSKWKFPAVIFVVSVNSTRVMALAHISRGLCANMGWCTTSKALVLSTQADSYNAETLIFIMSCSYNLPPESKWCFDLEWWNFQSTPTKGTQSTHASSQSCGENLDVRKGDVFGGFTLDRMIHSLQEPNSSVVENPWHFTSGIIQRQDTVTEKCPVERTPVGNLRKQHSSTTGLSFGLSFSCSRHR